jgi:hypothetical protein
MADTGFPPMQTYWVIPGKLLAGEYPGTRMISDPRLITKLHYLIELKISYFLDLTESGILAPYNEPLFQESARSGWSVNYRRFPITDFGIPSCARMKEVLDILDGALQSGQAVYVHCWAGVGRTGTVVGCFLVRHGLSGKQALARLVELRAGLENAGRRSPESDEQIQMVENWGKKSLREDMII